MKAIRYRFEDQKEIAGASIVGTYLPVGGASASLLNPAVQWKLDNLTDADLQFSTDGVNDHFVMPAQSSWINDISSNEPSTTGLFLSKGDRLFVKQIEVPANGKSVYFSIAYASED